MVKFSGVLPIVFRTTDTSNISFTWEEASKNIGYVRYYAALATDTGAMRKFLTTKIIDSYPQEETNDFNYDFDYELKVPLTVAAENCIVNFTGYSDGGSNDYTISIIHYDGATETVLGTKDVAQPGITNNFRLCALIPLTQKSFKRGDTIRVSVTTNGSFVSTDHTYFDPGSGETLTDAYGRTVSTDFVVDIPFKIQA